MDWYTGVCASGRYNFTNETQLTEFRYLLDMSTEEIVALSGASPGLLTHRPMQPLHVHLCTLTSLSVARASLRVLQAPST